jgi:hypothetical protein
MSRSLFFTLPAELRLQVYSNLVVSSMADGRTDHIIGLMLSCREIHGEMMTDCITKVQPILQAMGGWKATHPDGAPLRLELSLGYSFITPPTEAKIRIPTSVGWWPSPNRLSFIPELRDSFTISMCCLAPVFCQTWTKLTLQVCYPEIVTERMHALDAIVSRHYQMDKVYISLLHLLSPVYGDLCEEPTYLTRTDFLVLVFDVDASLPHEDVNLGKPGISSDEYYHCIQMAATPDKNSHEFDKRVTWTTGEEGTKWEFGYRLDNHRT